MMEIRGKGRGGSRIGEGCDLICAGDLVELPLHIGKSYVSSYVVSLRAPEQNGTDRECLEFSRAAYVGLYQPAIQQL